MAEKHFVVIGSGPAGNQAAFTLRENAPEARITVISKGRESSCVPSLLPDFIAGKIDEQGLLVCQVGSYKASGIKLRCSQEVVDLNIQAKELILAHKEIVPFDGLIIAVGGMPRIPERLQVFQDVMFTLKTLEDANFWIDRLKKVESVMMIGGDLTSLAVTKTLISLNKKVYFILNEDAFWPLRSNEELFAAVATRLAERGVDVLVGRNVKSLQRLAGGEIQVQVDNQYITVGMVGAFFGLVPEIRFLARSGLRIDRGVLVDEYLCTGVEGIYATGDCAQIYHPEISDYWISLGHENARTLGHVAALNLVHGDKQLEVKPQSIFEVQGINVNTSWWTEF